MSIAVTANGRAVALAGDATVAHLLAALGLAPAEVLAVEHNGEAVGRNAFATRRLADGDRVELVRVAAGG